MNASGAVPALPANANCSVQAPGAFARSEVDEGKLTHERFSCLHPGGALSAFASASFRFAPVCPFLNAPQGTVSKDRESHL